MQFNRAFTRRTLTSNEALEGNAFASFLLGAPSGGAVDVNPKPHYEWFFLAPWIQDDWRLNDKMTVNLGFRWDFNGAVSESDNMLNYAFDPTIVNPVSARVGQQVMGGLRFAGVDGAPDRPWRYDKNNYQFRVARPDQLNNKTVLRAGYGKYFLNPTSTSNNSGFGLSTPILTSNDGNRTPTYALGNPWPNGIDGFLRQLVGPGDVPRPRPDHLEPGLRRAERPPVLGRYPARAAVAHLARGDLRRQPQLRHRRQFRRLQRALGRVPGAVRRDPRRQPRACAIRRFRIRSSVSPASRTRTGSRARPSSRFELARPFPAFTGFGYNQQNLGTMHSLLHAARRQQTVGRA